MKKPNFFEELKRRNVYKVGVAYGITAWLLAQVADLAADTFEAPPWVMKVILVVLITGFPVALLLAWVFEMTPEGIVRTERLDEDSDQAVTRSIRHPLVNNAVIIILLVLLISQFAYNHFTIPDTNHVAAQVDDQNYSIAVLPLLNLNSQSENLEFFSDGLTQEIIDELSQVRALTMIAFTSTIRFKNTDKSNQSIANDLNVNYLISGTSRVYGEGDSVKISLELIDPANNDQRLWNNTYTELMANAPGIQNRIAKHVAQNLNIELSSEEQIKLDQPNTTSGEAYRLFLLARSEFFKLNKQGFSRSIEVLQEVVAIDPNFAQAQTFLAWAYQLASNPWFDGHINKPISELNEFVSPIIEKSLELDPSNSDIYLVRGHQSAFLDAQLREAKRDVDYGLKLNSWPVVPTTYCMCIVVSTYVALDDIEPAADLIAMARKLDPGSVFIEWDAANVLMKQGKYIEAQKLYFDAAQTSPVSMFKSFLGWNYYHTGEYEKAKEQLINTYKESELPVTLNVSMLSSTFYKLGDQLNADKYLDELLTRRSSGELHIEQYLAHIYLERGEKETALAYLQESWDKRNWGMALFLNLDPSFKSLYTDPIFRDIRSAMQYY